jgi:hypothetical protein
MDSQAHSPIWWKIIWSGPIMSSTQLKIYIEKECDLITKYQLSSKSNLGMSTPYLPGRQEEEQNIYVMGLFACSANTTSYLHPVQLFDPHQFRGVDTSLSRSLSSSQPRNRNPDVE